MIEHIINIIDQLSPLLILILIYYMVATDENAGKPFTFRISESEYEDCTIIGEDD